MTPRATLQPSDLGMTGLLNEAASLRDFAAASRFNVAQEISPARTEHGRPRSFTFAQTPQPGDMDTGGLILPQVKCGLRT